MMKRVVSRAMMVMSVLVLTACGGKADDDSAADAGATSECSMSVPADCDATDPSAEGVECSTSGMGPRACTIVCYCCDSSVSISQCAGSVCASSPDDCADVCAGYSVIGGMPDEPVDTYTGEWCFEPS
jgi:hypothetical protein